MSIISAKDQMSVLPSDADDTDGLVTLAASSASSFINTWTARKYYPFEDFNSTTGTARAPAIIVAKCKEIGKAFYYLSIDEEDRDGDEKEKWTKYLDRQQKILPDIHIPASINTQVVSFDSNGAMLIGADNGIGYPQIIPFNAKVASGSTNVWINNTNFFVRKGGLNTDEYPDAWYLYRVDTDLEGTLTYTRTYRSDGADYASMGN